MSPSRPFPHLPADAWELFLRDELPGPSERKLEDHLDECPECVSVLEERDPSRIFRRLRGLQVRADKAEDVWSGFFEGIAREIQSTDDSTQDARAPRSRRVPSGRQTWRERTGYLAGVASFVLAVVLFHDGTPLRQATTTLPCPPDVIASSTLQQPLSCEEYQSLYEVRFEAPSQVVIVPNLDLETL
jgi:hypothetical protein